MRRESTPAQWLLWSAEVLVLTYGLTWIVDVTLLGEMPRAARIVVSMTIVVPMLWAYIAVRHAPPAQEQEPHDRSELPTPS
jgi:hypothetical protein